MKYSVPNRMPARFLGKGDEIKVRASDVNKTIDYIKDYPKAQIVLCIEDSYNEIQIKVLNEQAKGRFTCELEDISIFQFFKTNQIPFYWKYPATTFDELKALKDLGVAQVLIDGEIFFKMAEVKKFGVPVRVIPNVCYTDSIPRVSGLHGTWVRPVDVKLYEPYVSMMEFQETDSVKWGALLDTYQSGIYLGDLNTIFKDFNSPDPIPADCIPSDIPKARLKCGQRCAVNRCHLCDTGLRTGINAFIEERKKTYEGQSN